MECNYFGVCGACRVYEKSYEEGLQEKHSAIKKEFSQLYNGDIAIFASKTQHYRSRCEFKIWYEGEKISYAMTKITKDGVVLIDACPQVSEPIAKLMPKLLSYVQENGLSNRLFQVDFLASSRGEIVVSLLYHKQIDASMQEAIQAAAQHLSIHIIARSKNQKLTFGADFVVEYLHVNGKEFLFEYIENSFTQPNHSVNEKMITWTLEATQELKGDLLELYCGAGNFTIPFATHFGRVLATEIAKSSINAAINNMKRNGITNIEFVRMSAQEFVQALDGVRVFNRMRHVNLTQYCINTIFVDPPRSGMDALTTAFASRFENIIYISCNPETLKRDLTILEQTHTIESMALFDQFAYTHHAEMGVKLKKRVLI